MTKIVWQDLMNRKFLNFWGRRINRYSALCIWGRRMKLTKKKYVCIYIYIYFLCVYLFIYFVVVMPLLPGLGSRQINIYTYKSFRRVFLPDGFARFYGDLSKNIVITEILKMAALVLLEKWGCDQQWGEVSQRQKCPLLISQVLLFKGCYCYNHMVRHLYAVAAHGGLSALLSVWWGRLTKKRAAKMRRYDFCCVSEWLWQPPPSYQHLDGWQRDFTA